MENIQYKAQDYQHKMENYNRFDNNAAPGHVVVGMEPQHHSLSTNMLTVQESQKPFAYDTVILNIITYLCCCPMCGLIGLVAAIMSFTDHKTNDPVSHRSKRNIALGCGIAGIVIGFIAIVTVIALYVTVISAAVNAAEDRGYD